MSSLNLQLTSPGQLYPYKPFKKVSWLERYLQTRAETFHKLWLTHPSRLNQFVTRVEQIGQPHNALSDQQLRQGIAQARRDLRVGRKDALEKWFALVQETSARQLGMRHFAAQLRGGWVMANGMIAEMETGQGKTLTATLAASAAAAIGIPTHVITVNDYLAKRDADNMRPLYEALGLSVGVVLEGMSDADKRCAYQCDITYGTNKTIAFDHLRDRMMMGNKFSNTRLQIEKLFKPDAKVDKLVMRGLGFAIIDEVDSVLIDEASTPLILSAPRDNENKRVIYKKALKLVDELKLGEHYTLHKHLQLIELTVAGKQKLNDIGHAMGGLWVNTIARNELVDNALRAKHFFEVDKQYVVQEEKVQIVDEFTGRIMADRSWQQGLHQMIEVKENLDMTQDRETIARISYQRFFGRYINLAGMTGTAREVKTELAEVYGLHTIRVQPEQTLQRTIHPEIYCATESEKWAEVASLIEKVHATGQPILVGTRSVKASEHLSGLLKQKRLTHQLLNARQDKEEAEMIAQAGQVGAIMVATNMAGRGTDIKLSPESKALGGLYVIMTERHESRRIDRQLFGRCGRQGDPGQVQPIVSLEDDLIVHHCPKALKSLGQQWIKISHAKGRSGLAKLYQTSQNIAGTRQYKARQQVKKSDEYFGKVLAFSGEME